MRKKIVMAHDDMKMQMHFQVGQQRMQ